MVQLFNSIPFGDGHGHIYTHTDHDVYPYGDIYPYSHANTLAPGGERAGGL